MNTDAILNATIQQGRDASAKLAVQFAKPLTQAEIHERFNTLAKAREYIANIQPSLKRLAELEAAPKQIAAPVVVPVETAAPKTPKPMTLEKRYHARIATAEAEIEKAKTAVLEATIPAAQTIAMRELRMKEQRLNFERKNFQ